MIGMDTLLCIQLYSQAVEYSHGKVAGLDHGPVLLREWRGTFWYVAERLKSLQCSA